MPAWLSRLWSEWAVISAAPIALAVAIVLPAALTWAAVDWSYRSEVARLSGRLAAYRDALGGTGPEQAADDIRSLRHDLAAAKLQLAKLQSPDREPNALYQNGRRVGIIDGAEIDAANKSVVFQRMAADRELDQATNLEFRDLVLGFKGYAAVTRTGQSPGVIYHGPRFAVVGRRSEDCTNPTAPDDAAE